MSELFEEPQEAEVIEEKQLTKPKSNQKITVTKKELQQQPTVEHLLLAAVKQGVDIEALNRLLDLKERIDAKNAEKSFNEAMANFQKECGVILSKTDGAKTKTSNKAAWKYAALQDIEPVIKKPLANNGLSYSWDSEDIERAGKPGRKTVCTITHVLGHKKSASFTSAIDSGTSLMNSIQKEGSTIEYGRRNSLKMVLGLVIAGEDDDGQNAGAPSEVITEEQKTEIEKLLGTSDAVLFNKILSFYEVETLSMIPADSFQQCKNKISTYKAAKAKKGTKK